VTFCVQGELVGATRIGHPAPVPLVDITYDARIDEPRLRRLAALLEEIVPHAVDCPEEPVVGPPAAGDLEIRFHPRGALDVGDLSLVVEVRTKRFESRVENAQQRADMIREHLSPLAVGPVGVWLVLHDGAWSQT
jgi:hypothetical protein